MRHICLYIGVQIFIARAGAGPPEVLQEALADLKNYEEEEEGTIAVEPVLALSPIEFFPEHGIEH